MTIKYNIKIFQWALQNKPIFVALIATIPSLFLWLSATLSFLYINYVGPFIFGLSGIGEFIVFLIIPVIGISSAIFSYKRKRGKLSKYLFMVNAILLLFVLLSSFFLS
jgi:hypothetical protein